MANLWITHVKEFAKKHNLNYRQALRHPDIKKDYKKVPKKNCLCEEPVEGGAINISKAFNKSLKKTKKAFTKFGDQVKDVAQDVKEGVEDTANKVEDTYYDSAKYYKKNIRPIVSPILDKVLQYGGPMISNAVASSIESTLIAEGVPPAQAKQIGKMGGDLTVKGLKEAKSVSGLGLEPLVKRIRKQRIKGQLINGGSFKPG